MNSYFKFKTVKPGLCLLVIIGSFIFLSSFAAAQNLPDKIRGYKVYEAKILVKNQPVSDSDAAELEKETEAFVKVGEPQIVDVSLTGVTFELSAEIKALVQSGTIDFLIFRDFRVNGLKVNVEEYTESFSFIRNQAITLPKPVKIFIGTGQTLRGALKEFKDSKEQWTVTGTVFVFGRFKKSILKFKRVIPIQVNLKIKNPLKEDSSI